MKTRGSCPYKKLVHVEIIAFAKPRRVTFSGHADSLLLPARLVPAGSEVAPLCKQRFLLFDINSWS